MEFSKIFLTIFAVQALLITSATQLASPATSDIFREYIGAEFNNIKFSDVPINPNVEFHFILAFAIDYTTSSSPSPTNGKYNIFWDNGNLGASQVSAIKKKHSNVKVALSLGGDSVGDGSIHILEETEMSTNFTKNDHLDLIKIFKNNLLCSSIALNTILDGYLEHNSLCSKSGHLSCCLKYLTKPEKCWQG